jgi:hypothetical protein
MGGKNIPYVICPLQSRLQYIYYGQPYARIDFIPQSGTLDLALGLAGVLYRIPNIRVFSYYVSLFLFSERNPSSGNKESSAFFGNNIETVRWCHKVHIYLEYHCVCPFVRIGTTPPPLPQACYPTLGHLGCG